MNWQEFWNSKAHQVHPMDSVGRTVQGKAMSDLTLHKIAELIASQLHLQGQDQLLDVCCGNGELTVLLQKFAGQISAVDFSPVLIEQAQKKHGSQINWHCADAAKFELDQQFDCILLYFSFQYFETNRQALAVLRNLSKHLKPNGRMLIGDIPDISKKSIYYKGFLAKLKSHYHHLLGKNDMGKFWSKKQLITLCKKAGLEGLALDQQAWQPYSSYRFDLFIQKSKRV